MPTIRTQAVNMIAKNGVSAINQLEFEVYGQKERVRRAFKTLGKVWLFALAAVLVPIIHYVLVPLLILTGPVLFFYFLNKKESMLTQKLPCSVCHEKIELEFSKPRLPAELHCKTCRDFLILQGAE